MITFLEFVKLKEADYLQDRVYRVPGTKGKAKPTDQISQNARGTNYSTIVLKNDRMCRK